MLDWGKYITVADRFQHKVRAQDREDLRQDIILRLAQVARNNGHKPFTEPAMIRVASYELSDYWVKQRRLTTWLDCGNCSKEQRRKCREELLYSECPKFHQLVSLNTVVGDGQKAELIDFLADDKASDIVARLDARRILQGFPKRIVQIAYKLYSGYPLDKAERRYLERFRQEELKKHQKALF